MKKSTIVASPLAFLLVGSLAIPAVGGDLVGTLKIVSSLPRTGSANAQTTSIVNGIRMAIDEVNGMVDGYTIAYEDWDDASPQRGNWDPAVEGENAKKAARDDEIIGYIGTFNSGAAKIAMPILNKAGLVMISPANTYPGLTKPGLGEANEPRVYRPSGTINYFRIVPTDDLQGAVAADWAKELGATRVFVLHDRELYGKGIADVFVHHSKEIGTEIVGAEGIDTKASNYRSLCTKIRATNPQLVFFGGTTQTNAGQIVKDLRGAGITVPFMVPDGCFENAFIEAAGADNVNGSAYITFGGLPAEEMTGRGAEFVKAYVVKYGIKPEAYSAYGYECCKVLLEAIRRAPVKDRAGILKAVSETKDFDGALGVWSFDANGDTSNRTLSGQTVKDGKFAFVKVLGRSDAPAVSPAATDAAK
ncbi:MAG: branched-chain amino acid ABC transporter substrate-binding protein [Planctomycetota bacterium]|nr:branched-chain amino acid ABC transporter substrate-binding protein [Planctomycetota bacterium]